MKLHEVQESDADRLLGVWNGSALFDPLTPGLLHEKLWGDSAYQRDLALAAGDHQQLLGFGMAVVRTIGGRPTGVIKLLAVAPDVQRQGIGSAVCQELEARCQQSGAVEMRVGESAPNYLVPGVDKRYQAGLAFFRRQGFTQSGEACNMRVDLERWSKALPSAEAEIADVQAEIVRASRSHEPAIRNFIERHWPSWWGEVSAALANDPVTLFIAVDGQSVVGFAAHDANNQGTGWFGPMGTAPSCRGRGLGGRLLAACLTDMHQAGHRTATIPWVGPTEFYAQRTGAVVDREFIRFTKRLGA